MNAYQDAEVAHKLVTTLRTKMQQLTDASKAGIVISHEELHELSKDCAVLGYAVAKTFHTVSRESDRRRVEVVHG